MKLTREEKTTTARILIIFIVIIILAAIRIYDTARDENAIMREYMILNYTDTEESMMLSSAINMMISNIEASRTLRSSEKAELLSTIVSAARMLKMDVNADNEGDSLEIKDTAMSVVNLAGIYYNNHDLPPSRAFEVLITRGDNQDDRESRIWIQRYLENRGGNTPISQFETRIMEYHREVFDGQTPPIMYWSIAEINQVIQHWLQMEGRS